MSKSNNMSPGNVEMVPVKQLVLDDAFNMRVDVPDHSDYVEAAREGKGWPFPPIKAFKKGAKWKVVDGFTRTRAAIETDLELMPVEPITEDEALKVACGANTFHGYRRTAADRTKAVTRAMAEWPTATAAQLAEICQVSTRHIFRLRASLEEGISPSVESTVDALVGIQKEPCPVCKLNSWIVHDDGVRCAGCNHVEGEPAAVDDAPQSPQKPTKATKAASKAKSPPKGKPAKAAKPEPKGKQSKPEPKADTKPTTKKPITTTESKAKAQAVDVKLKKIGELETKLGGLIREFQEAGLNKAGVMSAWGVLKEALARAKGKK